jgi:L-phenylalanine/L-methionine N-acetyltransferase
MTRIRVRAMEPSDIEAISEIMGSPGVIRNTLQTPYQSVEWRRERFANFRPGTRSLVAEIDGRVVGNLGLTPEGPDRRKHVGSIGMAVHDDFQGQGVGTVLMEVMIELAERWMGLTRIELTVFTDNAPAIALYKKFGFEIEGMAPRYALRDGEYADAYYMARVSSRPQV